MKRNIALFLSAFYLCAAGAHCAGEGLFMGSEDSKKIMVHNRVLAKVNGKVISVYDVMKKMDMLFYKQFPEFTSSVLARYQFYNINWTQLLQDLVDKELILADAEEAKLQVTAGDIRQELESLFGPNIHGNLDKVGLTFSEAWKMIQSDIMIKRMMYVKVHSKALKQVTPQAVRAKYEEFAQANIRPDVWTYKTITLRDRNKTKGAEAAYQAHQLLTEEQVPLADLSAKMAGLASVSESTKVTISDAIKNSDKEIAPANKEVLTQLTPGSFSTPIAQKSRQDGTIVYRIFYLQDFKPGGLVPFNEVEKRIKDKLTDDAINKEAEAYIKKLRKHFDVEVNHIDELTAEGFEPFTLG